MANTSAPFGFSYVGSVNGPVNFSTQQRLIASNNGTKIYYGDAVVPVTSSATGYIMQATASTVAVAGIFFGCSYFSTSQAKTVYSRYWPGSDATGDVTAFVCSDPLAIFKVQAGATAVGVSKIGQNIQLNVGTGSTVTGTSGMYVESPNTTVTLPFIVYDVVTSPPGSNGTDPTSGYNFVLVAFNNEIFKAGLLGIS